MKLIGVKPNDAAYSNYSGRAYVKETIGPSGEYYDMGFVAGNFYIENKGSETVYASFKTVSDMDKPVTDEPTVIHTEIAGSTSRIYMKRYERYVKLFTASGSSEVILEAW